MKMQIPIEVIQAAIALIGWLVVKSIYGSIDRNKTDSDNADEKVDLKIDRLDEKIQANFEKFVSNDRDLYQQVGELKERLARLEEKNNV